MTIAHADEWVTTSTRRVREARRFVILGAGLTGLSAAARLEELGERDYLLLEKEDRPGGWAKTDWSGCYGADRAIHVLYFRDDAVRRRVEELLRGRWIRHAKKCVVDSGGIRTPFPFHANLHGRPPDVIAECLSGLWEASVSRETSATPENFLEWILRSYGPGVARHFMVPYNTKMWTVPPEQMAADWTGGFIPRVDFRRSLDGALLKLDSLVGLNAEFFYPEAGISTLAETLTSGLHGSIRYNTVATTIAANEKLVHLSDGSIVPFDSVISTIPLPRLAYITRGLSPSVRATAGTLQALDLALVDVGVRQPRDDGVHWAYLPDENVLGYRLHAVHNLSDRMSPKGHGLYTVEIAHSRHRPLPKESLQARVVADLIRIKWLRSTSQVTFLRERRHTTAYALPLTGSAKVSAAVRRCLEARDIHSVGRFGEWKYSNMEDALIDGRAAVDRVMAGTAARVPR